MNSELGVVEVDKGPRGRNRLLGVRLLGVLYDAPCSVSLWSPSSSPSLSSSSSLLLLFRLNGSWNKPSECATHVSMQTMGRAALGCVKTDKAVFGLKKGNVREKYGMLKQTIRNECWQWWVQAKWYMNVNNGWGMLEKVKNNPLN